MSLPTATLATYEGIGIREDLEDTIWDLFPMDTYLLTNLDKIGADNTLHEWQLDSLAAATLNASLEGDDAQYGSIDQPTRMKNYLQISTKALVISNTMEAVKKAGRKSEMTRQLMKKMKEFKRDVEKALIGNQAASAGTHASGRTSAGMESWIASTDHGGNGIRASTTLATSTIGYTSTTAVAAPADGGITTAAFVIGNLNNALTEAWTDGGNPSLILTGAAQRAVIDGFTSIATRFIDVDRGAPGDTPIATTAGVFVSDFGRHTLVLSRYMRASVVLCVDPEYWATAWLRRPEVQTLAPTGDAVKRLITGEYCLVARNPNSSAKIPGLT